MYIAVLLKHIPSQTETCYNVPVILLTLFYDLTGTAMIYAVAILATLTYRRIAVTLTMSPQSKNVQMQLLVAACVQVQCRDVNLIKIPYLGFRSNNLPVEL